MPEIVEDHRGIDVARGKADQTEPSEEAWQRFRKSFEGLPDGLQEIFGETEKRYLTMLGQKDQATLEHSLGVVMIGNRELGELSEDLEKEGVSREAFLRACALHDVGKLELPDCILKGTITQEQFGRYFFQLKQTDPSFINQRLHDSGRLDTGQLIQDMDDEAIRSMRLDYRDFVSLQQCFNDNQTALDEIKRYHLDPQTTSFMDALRQHEQKSREIIDASDVPDAHLVAELAGSHHHYSKRKSETQPQSKEVLRLSVVASELLHLADVCNAIRQARTYQAPHSEIDTLYIIMNETKRGTFQTDISQRWLRRALKDIDERGVISIGEEKEHYSAILSFIGGKPDISR